MKKTTGKSIPPRQLILPVILVGCLLAAILWGLSLDGALPGHDQNATELIISEVCAKNDAILADNDGRYRDYIELYNGGEAINLKGYWLTDGSAQSQPFGDLPLPSGSYLVLFLDKELTGFSLDSASEETVMLVNPHRKTVAQVTTKPMGSDEVLLYGDPDYTLSKTATPGFPNTKAGLQAFQEGSVNEAPLLKISEVLTQNASSLPDEQGNFSDVVELYNSGSAPIYLGEYWLSDDPQFRFRYRLPAIELNAGDYVTLYCDGENYVGQNGEIHANFALSRGETLCLTGKDGSYNTLPVSFPGENISWALNSEGEYAASPVSLGYANDAVGIATFSESRMAENPALVVRELLLSASDVPYRGEFIDVVEIYNRSDAPVDTAGWYLSDGGDPYCYPLPQQILAPGECMVIPCGRAQTGFSLSTKEVLCLMAPGGKWASRVACSNVAQGQSVQLIDTGLYTTGPVSLGFENTDAGVKLFQQQFLLGTLRISEMMSTNASYLKGSYGKTCDWIELYNASGQSINLKDYAISTDAGDLQECPLPDKTLAPGAYCVLLMSEKDIYLSGYTRLPANLSANGEAVYLSQNGTVVDYAILPAMATDISYGRENGNGAFSCLSVPTPGSGNGSAVALSAVPEASAPQGAYDAALDITLSGSGAVYYTTDCTAPTAESTRYTGPIHLDRTAVIRAVCIEPGKMPSEILTLTYVIGEGHSLPVVSLVTEPDNLWDYNTGIYVEGPNASATSPHWGANYWQNWEKEATISLFELDGTGFSEPCGISIFGAYSRAQATKAFDVKFRDFYGTGSLDYSLFGDKGISSYESFILRCSGQDAMVARMRDVLLTSLVADQTTVAVQKYRPVVLYLNGEFWGVYYIREKTNEHFVAGNYNADPKDVSITEFNGNTEYKKMVEYAHTHDLSQQEHYDYICSQMDVDNYIDFMIAQMYIANIDIDNIKFFKTTDLKWTWLFYDTDLSFSSSDYDTVKDYTHPSGTGGGRALSTKLINALLKNPEFKEKFISRFAWQMNNIWSVENVTARVDELEALIAEDMKRDCQKWGRSYSGWQGSVDYLRKFPASRNKKLPAFVQSYFGLTDQQMIDYGFPVQEGA